MTDNGNMEAAGKRKGKVMIVDDEPDIITYLTVLFEENGFETMPVMDADEVLDAARRFSPDIMMLDIMMPKKTGITIYLALKNDVSLKNIPVIIVSAFNRKKDFPVANFEELLSKSGAPEPEGYAEKPINRRALLEKTMRILDNRAVNLP